MEVGPSKLNAKVHKCLVECVALGMTYKQAAQSAGITYRGFRYWITHGEKAKDGPLFQLFHDISRAKARGIQARLKAVAKAGRKDWRAHTWWLERVCPEQFGCNRLEVAEFMKLLRKGEKQSAASRKARKAG